MRPFNAFEQKNLRFLVNHNIKFTQVEVTPTGLAKSILDATAPMRAYFLESGIHDYGGQLQGTRHKAMKRAAILTEGDVIGTAASFYRPVTKKGDPRMWIYKLGQCTEGHDIYVLVWRDECLYAINITRTDVERAYGSPVITPLREVIEAIYLESTDVARELLGRFRSVRDTWFTSEVQADTGIGRAIESFLGIPMNSAKTPDYKGIELKSHREKRSSKKNVLFTKAPDWDISAFKSASAIVAKYGYYQAAGVKKTYQNTVQCGKTNSQHLLLNVDQIAELLQLRADFPKTEDVAAWRLVNLHESLRTKHRETFWIEVDNRVEDGIERFRYKQIEHTRNPNIGQFDILLERSLITLDLLLCRPSGRGDTYSFKVKKDGFRLLFPESVVYNL